MRKIPSEAKDRIILPLDFPSFETARPMISSLKNHVGLFKVGLTLFFKEGIQVIRKIEDIVGENRIFLDLKLYDTPMQVGSAAAILKSEAPKLRFLTVHTSGGLRVIKAVVEAMGAETTILGVTALTSLAQNESTGEDASEVIADRVIKLAGIAEEAGAGGVVASAQEASRLKTIYGDKLAVVTPGIRPEWSAVKNDDQRRIMSPKDAISNGADYLVIGRPIYGDKDPVGAAEKIAAEITAA